MSNEIDMTCIHESHTCGANLYAFFAKCATSNGLHVSGGRRSLSTIFVHVVSNVLVVLAIAITGCDNYYHYSCAGLIVGSDHRGLDGVQVCVQRACLGSADEAGLAAVLDPIASRTSSGGVYTSAFLGNGVSTIIAKPAPLQGSKADIAHKGRLSGSSLSLWPLEIMAWSRR